MSGLGFVSKAKNLTAALAHGRLRAVQGIERAAEDVWSSTSV